MKHFLLLATVIFGNMLLAQTYPTPKEIAKKTNKFLKAKDYVYVPTAHFIKRSKDHDVPFVETQGPDEITIDSVFMGKFELSNWEYLLYVDYLEQTQPELVNKALPDTSVWRRPLSYCEPYVEYYLRHPAYRYYPVVGVSFEQATAYAKWATISYNQSADRIFEKVIIRIPTEDEWQNAACSGKEYQKLPWLGESVFDEDGELRANFGYVPQTAIYKDSLLTTHAQKDTLIKKEFLIGAGFDNNMVDILAPVDAYSPNDYGLYNMGGNVAEYVISNKGGNAIQYDYFQPIDSISGEGKHITRGGSWRDPGAYMRTDIRQFYDDSNSTSVEVGFRLVLQVIEY